jgi:hypothetical protein
VKAAEAEAEARFLQGKGIARQRQVRLREAPGGRGARMGFLVGSAGWLHLRRHAPTLRAHYCVRRRPRPAHSVPTLPVFHPPPPPRSRPFFCNVRPSSTACATAFRTSAASFMASATRRSWSCCWSRRWWRRGNMGYVLCGSTGALVGVPLTVPDTASCRSMPVST